VPPHAYGSSRGSSVVQAAPRSSSARSTTTQGSACAAQSEGNRAHHARTRQTNLAALRASVYVSWYIARKNRVQRAASKTKASLPAAEARRPLPSLVGDGRQGEAVEEPAR
jgi:hypothetical protein